MLPLALPVAGPRDAALYVRTSAPVTFAAGFYPEEYEGSQPFCWMGPCGRLTFEPSAEPRFLEVGILSEFHDLSQELTVRTGDVHLITPLGRGWALLSLPVPAGVGDLELAVNKIFPPEYYPADSRTLCVRLRRPRLHADPARHAHIVRQHENALRNAREMQAGRVALESTPVSLGIDLYGVCNIKPPCVYCEWDFAKNAEGDFVDTPFTVGTLEEWGPFFDNSRNLVNCSIGEPFMMKNLDDLLDAFGNAGKTLEMTTNGQILTDRNIQKLLGRDIDLYVSLDAGTAQTYAKLRNRRFDSILDNLRRLIAAKGGPGGLPRINLVFMPMRVNVTELDAFVRICADLRVDRLVLRPLNASDTSSLDWERGGYHFEYQKELLPFGELVRVSGRAAELCRRLGVPLADQMDFGGTMGATFDKLFEEGRRSAGEEAPAAAPAVKGAESAQTFPAGRTGTEPPMARQPDNAVATLPAALPSLGSERTPLCTEPWKSLYILRRGVYPCCYGSDSLGTMDTYREAWNAPLMQEIRAELAQGRLHSYCLRSISCPIVRKSEQAHDLSAGQSAYMRVRHLWHRINRVTGGRAQTLVHRGLAAIGRIRQKARSIVQRGRPQTAM
jgi:hypothetical protein